MISLWNQEHPASPLRSPGKIILQMGDSPATELITGKCLQFAIKFCSKLSNGMIQIIPNQRNYITFFPNRLDHVH